MGTTTSYELNPVVSRYTDFLDEPLTPFLTPSIDYQRIPLVTLEESVEPIAHLFDKIETKVSMNMDNPTDGLSEDESRSIHLYTMPSDSDLCFSQVLNKALRDEDRQTLEPWFPFLKLFLTALDKLPSQRMTVWRGVRGVDLCSKYPVGSKHIWWGVSSCTASFEVLKGEQNLGKKGLRTIFCIECENGKSIANHSYFQENEIILMPGFHFEVLDHWSPEKDLFFIQLREIQPVPPHLQVPIKISMDQVDTVCLGKYAGDITIFDINEQAKYDIFISYADRDESIIERIKNSLPQRYSTHVKADFSSINIKTYLDNTSMAVVAIINRAYELSEICQADMIHTFKRQFPLIFVISEDDFKPTANWLSLVWNAPNTQKFLLNSPDFKNLRNTKTYARWNLSRNLNTSKLIQSSIVERSNRFLGNYHEWTVAYSNPAQVSQNYRQFIDDPFRIDTDIKLQDFYDNYIRSYFQNSKLISLFKTAAHKNDIIKFVKGYTKYGEFSTTLNHHLADNVLFYFEPILYDIVDYQLLKSLIDFVTLCLYRQELQPYQFKGIVHRGALMSEEDLLRYVVGSRIMNTTFLSTSKDKQVVEFYSGQNQRIFAVICTYVIYNKNNRRTALDISTISHFVHEQEVLILPFSAFYVKSVTRSPDHSNLIEMMLIEDDYDILEDIDISYNDDD
jgi:hypothetical protein